MKQRITVKQLTELTHEQKLKLHAQWNPQVGDFYAWYKSKGAVDKVSYLVRDTNEPFDDPEAKLFALPLLSIGQMIEYLLENDAFEDEWGYDPMDVAGGVAIYWHGKDNGKELCDALWEAVKEVLRDSAIETTE